MEPLAWSEKGFWEAYFDGDEAAKTLFDTNVSGMTGIIISGALAAR